MTKKYCITKQPHIPRQWTDTLKALHSTLIHTPHTFAFNEKVAEMDLPQASTYRLLFTDLEATAYATEAGLGEPFLKEAIRLLAHEWHSIGGSTLRINAWKLAAPTTVTNAAVASYAFKKEASLSLVYPHKLIAALGPHLERPLHHLDLCHASLGARRLNPSKVHINVEAAAQLHLTTREIQDLEVGDLLILGKPGSISVRINGTPTFKGTVATVAGKNTLRIERNE